ncbi:hypothetical protein VQ045_06415 [Aurantimonas sp. E1-2-R+4]|uniref:hypothetical protein n=1 Tax=Aurantimonas sp. E1-2-R+4 TaxID=3113714 RepID=UPI002F91F5E8
MTVLFLAVAVAGVWEPVKQNMEDWVVWGWPYMTSIWFIFGLIVVLLLWSTAIFHTMEKDDASLEGIKVPKGIPMSGDDNRKGFFNKAPNFGVQSYNEAPQQRHAPPDLTASISHLAGSDTTIQVRIYGQDHEMQTLGRELVQAIAGAGVNALLFEGDHGTRYLSGVVIEPAPNAASREAAVLLATRLSDGGLKVALTDGPPVWKDQTFIRIGVGANG